MHENGADLPNNLPNNRLVAPRVLVALDAAGTFPGTRAHSSLTPFFGAAQQKRDIYLPGPSASTCSTRERPRTAPTEDHVVVGAGVKLAAILRAERRAVDVFKVSAERPLDLAAPHYEPR